MTVNRVLADQQGILAGRGTTLIIRDAIRLLEMTALRPDLAN